MVARLIAAIDDSAAARPVISVARALAEKVGSVLDVVHVGHGDGCTTAREIAAALDVPLRVVSGSVVEVLRAEARSDDVSGLVLGSRGLPGRRSPAGHVARELMSAVRKPVVLVPPELALTFSADRILVPVDAISTAVALRDVFAAIWSDGFDVVVLHVFDAGSVPMFTDQPQHELAAWADEFLARMQVSPDAPVRVEVRVGWPPHAVAEAIGQTQADLVLLAWSQDITAGHAEVVRHVLEATRVPVVLLPSTMPSRAIAAGARHGG